MSLQPLNTDESLLHFAPRILDIGGEGRHVQAWNLNPSRVRTLGSQRGSAIPRHILGRAEKIPFPDDSVAFIVCERTPLRNDAYKEIERVVAADGFVLLRHALPPREDPHRHAYRFFPHRIHQRIFMLANVRVQQTLFYHAGRERGFRGGVERRHGG